MTLQRIAINASKPLLDTVIEMGDFFTSVMNIAPPVF